MEDSHLHAGRQWGSSRCVAYNNLSPGQVPAMRRRNPSGLRSSVEAEPQFDSVSDRLDTSVPNLKGTGSGGKTVTRKECVIIALAVSMTYPSVGCRPSQTND